MTRTASRSTRTTCCIAGGGPAGMMLGFLLARAGVDVTVLEKHADFLRDFRGDTIHPSTLEIMSELGLLERFLARPHQEVAALSAQIGRTRLRIADFSRLPTRCKFIALMPQWDFLDFLANEGERYPGFHLRMETEVTGLRETGGRITGVVARDAEGDLDITADLVVGADGRKSVVRDKAGLPVQSLGAPMDVLWFRMPRRADDSPETFGHAEAGRIMVMLDRGDYWQCAYVIPKGSFAARQRQGIARFRDDVRDMSPFLGDRVDALGRWDDVKLLAVTVDRLERWHRPGLLCIGDAAHAMSPVGGVGINLAIQDAVAAANRLARPLGANTVSQADLEAVQKRRMFPTRLTQALQVAIQKRLIDAVLRRRHRLEAPAFVRAIPHIPFLRRLPAWIVGIGVRPEHIQTADVGAGPRHNA